MSLPLVLTPGVGYLSVGVHIIRTLDDWRQALDDIHKNFQKECSAFPSQVIQNTRFLLEEYVPGDEFAVDVYFDSEKKPVILNIFHHRFVSEIDVSDRLYISNKDIYDKYLIKFSSFLKNINSIIKLHDFPVHIEFRAKGDKIVPLEINPLRFAGMCLNEVLIHINGVHPLEAYLKDFHPDYHKMWQGKKHDSYSFIVLDKPASLPDEARLDFDKIEKEFSCVLESRKIENPNFGVFGLMFVKTATDNEVEFKRILELKTKDFIK